MDEFEDTPRLEAATAIADARTAVGDQATADAP
jgi:hypothetical protein